MVGHGDVSFYRDLLHKRVVDRDGHLVGAILDLAAGVPEGSSGRPAVERLVIRPHRRRRLRQAVAVGTQLILAWDTVEAVEPRRIRLRRPRAELAPSALEAGQILLHKQIMDQQIVDCRGLKLHRVNDIAMGWADGALHLWGMDTGIRGFLTRLGYRWAVLPLLRPLRKRLHRDLIRWDLVERLEPGRGHIRLRLSREEVRSTRGLASHHAE